ncbi:MAG: right-handed parallel beta-helix repeat-containing protein [Muribaculaceae bacterium]|nr:right-handed parallel beta-helix repeat-containing protein [Muribaculaceae bacterium]
MTSYQIFTHPCQSERIERTSAYGLRLLAIIFLLCTLFSSISFAAGPYLITDKNQVSRLNGDETDNTFRPDEQGQSEATLSKDADNAYSFTVKLNKSILLTDTEGLVVLFGRWQNEGSPKATKVEGRLNGSEWETIGYSYMQFRGGQGTIEYSKPIYADNKEYDELQFTVLKTALGYADGDKVRFNKFNVFLLKNGELYPDGRIDPWRLNTDYYTSYKDYIFEPTRGILDPRNHYGKNSDYPTETPWGENNTFNYQGRTYELPTFKMQGDNQMPHVTEHTVYVMPGEIIPLLPYYDMPRSPRYYEVFSHWYKYNVDINGEPQKQDYAHVIDQNSGERLLDFLVDPAGITITDNAGYFAGSSLPKLTGRFVIRTIADFKEFSKLVNEGQTGLNAILAADIDFDGEESVTIGSTVNPYVGSFNGNGHTISNMKIEGNANQAVGFFNNVASGVAIKNLILKNFNIKNGGNSGILIGEIASYNGSQGTESVRVDNVMISGDIEIIGSGHGGALVGSVGSNVVLYVKNVGFIGNVVGNSESAALVGYSNQYTSTQLDIENCYADGYVQNYKIDSYNGYYGAAVNTSENKLTMNNCVFNLRSSAFTDSGLQTYANQSGRGAINCGYECQIETKERIDNSSPAKIYVEKGNWSDFVLYFIRNSWDSPMSPQIGCDGFVEINGKEYGFFELNYSEWTSFGYGIVPYNGETSLKENDFRWEMAGLSTACEVDKDIKQRNKDEFVSISSKEFTQVVAENPVLSQWRVESGRPIPPMKHVEDDGLQTNMDSAEKYLSHPDEKFGEYYHSWYGASATFFKPLDTNKAPDDEENQKLGIHSFDIAADFSHEFDPSSDHNLDEDDKTIYSPIINFRHIFHVVSGKDFADDNTATAEANNKYLSSKRRVVSAPAGKNFQVRLPSEFPVPTSDNIYSSTNFYYKSGEKQYDRAYGFGIEIFKDGQELTTEKFYFERNPQSESGSNSSQGTREYYEGGPTYYTAGGDGVVHRMLQCDNPEEGTYIVRLYALDDNRNPVYIWNDEEKKSKIYMMEYEVTFISGRDVSFTTEDNIPDSHKDSYLQQEEVCGDPVVFLNFDEYCAFENTDIYDQDDYFLFKDVQSQSKVFYKYGEAGNPGFKSFKWPTKWSQCSYSFGYAGYMEYNYNEYMIANHASQVLWGTGAQGYNKNPDGSQGLYDRLYYDTDGEEKGFFYYVNAASDPGVTSRLQLDRLCLGSTVVVTAWVAEFSEQSEVANVAFNFSAVMKDGTRLRLHTFVTGYIGGRPDWHHVYYSFVPELPETINIGDIDHYELEVENNCKSSQGADYAVDDIRAYIVTPEITATQLSPMCDNEASSTGIQLRTRFDKLLASQGIVELDDETADSGNEAEKEEDTCDVYVAMFDKARYDADLSNENVSLTQALENSVVKLENAKGELQQWISFKMSKNFARLIKFDPNDPEKYYLTALGSTSEKGVNYLIANIRPDGSKIQVGKRYLVSIRLVDGSVANAEDITLGHFSVSEDDCAKYGVLTLQGSGIVKVDGFAYTTDNEIEVCAGQSPVLQVELLKVGEGKQTVSTEKYYYDWYLGPMDGLSDEEFIQLTNFRIDYKDETEIPIADRRVHGFEDLSDEAYAALVDKYAAIASLVRQGVLFLHQSSFVFPEISSDPDFNTNLVVTAIPIIDEQQEDGEKVCGGASEIRLKVNDASPKMYDGFPDIPYPGYMTDVPLRVGLRQLREVSTKVTAESLGIDRRLQVPLRAITSYKGEDSGAIMHRREKDYKGDKSDPFVYIVETNDPAYMTLTKHPGNDLVDPDLELITKDESGVVLGLLPVGLVTGMTAVKGEENNAVNIVFSKDMQFREGYYYKMRFDFDETLAETAEVTGYCSGQTVFTIKVVPEYQRWTGNAGRNWNNDGNWSRVAKSELFLGDGDNTIGEEGVPAADHTTDEGGNNTNAISYAPMDFTKVIIPNGTDNFPLMFEPTLKDVRTLQGNRKWDSVDTDGAASHHTATKDIKYDMASLSLESVLACRPWYANTCEQIHFQYGAELQRQQWFGFGKNYQKAWVDLETQPNRWYTLATPLKQVLAGDMYTISEGSKQNTELFRDINFNNDDYGRFDPAVYQRSWNRAGEAELYELDNSGSNTDASKGISLNWTHTYNQVDVDYSGGQGFSINTVPKIDPTSDENATEEEKDITVRFRLPKADDDYSYFDINDETEKADDKTLDIRDERHSLNSVPMTVTLKATKESKYFLTGNPFIARMDMTEFFKGNSGLSGKYWIMSDNRQYAYLWKGDGEEFISNTAGDDNGESVAPMQGFFVEANDPTTQLTVNFTADMIKATDGEGSAGPLKIAGRESNFRLLNIVAEVGEEEVSRAVICLAGDADSAYDEREDVAMIVDRSLDIPTAVYTSASGRALAINSLDCIQRTEVGVSAEPETCTVLHFEGVDEADGLKLLNTATGEAFDFYDGMTFKVEGNSAGHLYIVNSVESPDVADVTVMLNGRTVSVIAPTEGIEARAFDASGVSLGEWTSDGCHLSFDVASGVILVDVATSGRNMNRKFIVK